MKRLRTEYSQILKDINSLYSVYPREDNLYIWDVLLFGPVDTIFEGGIFKCELVFPNNYPFKPPQFRFITNIYHPNIYADGKVCISILHEGKDEWGYEKDSERWNPTQNVNSILLSIISLLYSPNFESPANIDASVLWKNNYDEYKKRIYKLVASTQ